MHKSQRKMGSKYFLLALVGLAGCCGTVQQVTIREHTIPVQPITADSVVALPVDPHYAEMLQAYIDEYDRTHQGKDTVTQVVEREVVRWRDKPLTEHDFYTEWLSPHQDTVMIAFHLEKEPYFSFNVRPTWISDIDTMRQDNPPPPTVGERVTTAVMWMGVGMALIAIIFLIVRAVRP